jgi:hypothetical protein
MTVRLFICGVCFDLFSLERAVQAFWLEETVGHIRGKLSPTIPEKTMTVKESLVREQRTFFWRVGQCLELNRSSCRVTGADVPDTHIISEDAEDVWWPVRGAGRRDPLIKPVELTARRSNK